MVDQNTKKHISIVASLFLANKKNQVLLVTAPKFKNLWVPPGGHVDYGEKADDAAIREIKEETGLEVDKATFLDFNEVIHSSDFTMQKHFLFMNYYSFIQEEEINLSSELSDYKWFDLKTVLDESDIQKHAKKSLKILVEKLSS